MTHGYLQAKGGKFSSFNTDHMTCKTENLYHCLLKKKCQLSWLKAKTEPMKTWSPLCSSILFFPDHPPSVEVWPLTVLLKLFPQTSQQRCGPRPLLILFDGAWFRPLLKWPHCSNKPAPQWPCIISLASPPCPHSSFLVLTSVRHAPRVSCTVVSRRLSGKVLFHSLINLSITYHLFRKYLLNCEQTLGDRK